MSLFDAFLEEDLLNPPLVREELWFALRTDGVIGKGTKADPYNGSTADLLDSLLLNSTLAWISTERN